MTRSQESGDRPTFTCPRCGMTSAHPKDVAEGYCGKCHDWTRDKVWTRDDDWARDDAWASNGDVSAIITLRKGRWLWRGTIAYKVRHGGYWSFEREVVPVRRARRRQRLVNALLREIPRTGAVIAWNEVEL